MLPDLFCGCFPNPKWKNNVELKITEKLEVLAILVQKSCGRLNRFSWSPPTDHFSSICFSFGLSGKEFVCSVVICWESRGSLWSLTGLMGAFYSPALWPQKRIEYGFFKSFAFLHKPLSNMPWETDRNKSCERKSKLDRSVSWELCFATAGRGSITRRWSASLEGRRCIISNCPHLLGWTDSRNSLPLVLFIKGSKCEKRPFVLSAVSAFHSLLPTIPGRIEPQISSLITTRGKVLFQKISWLLRNENQAILKVKQFYKWSGKIQDINTKIYYYYLVLFLDFIIFPEHLKSNKL